MLKMKKIFSVFVGAAMAVNGLMTMPFSAFAEKETDRTYKYDEYEVSYNVTNSWGNTEVVSVTLSNTGDSTIENWMLYFYPNGQVHDPVNAVEKQTSTGISYFKNSGYNADVKPDSSVSFSYMVDNCEEFPDKFTLCQKREEKESGYQVSLQVNQTWGDSFNGEIIIHNNTDKPIESWELTVDTNFTITEITNSWAATVTELESYSYLLKGTYTGTVYPNSSVSLGFNGVKSGEPVITDYSLTEVVVDEDVIWWTVNGYDDFYIDWSELPDSDNDGLPDKIEEKYNCDPLNPDTDGDGLPDGYEILTVGSDPANAHSLDSVLSDGECDNDDDGLSNYDEYKLGTDPLSGDTDFDGLSDGDEVKIYKTDPLNPDTDDDGLSDGDEIALGLNPLLKDSNKDGIPDNEEKFSQSLSYDTKDSDTVINSINISFEGTGYINSNTQIESIMKTDWMCSNIVGLIGEPYDISSYSLFDEAEITFKIDQSYISNTKFENLKILWYNEEEQRFIEMETVPDEKNSTLSTTVNHFSKYLIVDCEQWYNAWKENNYNITGNAIHTAITIDCSGSMRVSDKNFYRRTAAYGYVNTMSINDMASIILFSSKATESQELTNDKEKLNIAIEKCYSGGLTNFEEALRCAIDSLEKSNIPDADKVIIFLSDGKPTFIDNNGDEIEIAEDKFDYSLVNEAANKNIHIFTIGLDKDINEKILKEMARRTDGEYYYANNAMELVEYFLNINMEKKYDIKTDSDGDGIPDLFEIYGMPVANGKVLFSDPNVPDTDGDGLNDGEEVIVHIVNNDEEVENAYKNMYNYIPDAYVSNNGGICFEMVSDPQNEDTDGDGCLDSIDYDPLTYQLNGYFAHQMGKLQKAAQEYLGISDKYHPSDKYKTKKILWLCSYYIRQFNENYATDFWNNMAEKDEDFTIYVKINYPGLYSYFMNTKEIYFNDSGQTLDLYHCYAAISLMLDNPGQNVFWCLAEWLGDLQTVINEAYEETYKKNNYDNIGDALYNLMGDDSHCFGLKDLYADIDAVNLAYIIESNSEDNIEKIINQYYSLEEIDRNKQFVSNDHVNKIRIEWGITLLPPFNFINYNLSEDDIKSCVSAFAKYLEDTLEVEIK